MSSPTMHEDAKTWAAMTLVFSAIRRERVGLDEATSASIETYAADIPADELAVERADLLQRAARYVAWIESIDRRLAGA